MNELDSNAKISKILKVGERKGIGTIKDNFTGELSSTPEEALQFLLKAHFPDLAADPATGPGGSETPQQSQVSPENERILELICNRMLNRDALKAAFNSFQPFKAPGMDGIYPVLIKKGLDILEDQILSLYKKSIKGGRVPMQWTESRVAFIPKPGKEDYMDPKSYRPISLTSFLLMPRRARPAERRRRRTAAQRPRLRRPRVEEILAVRGRSVSVRLLSWTTSPWVTRQVTLPRWSVTICHTSPSSSSPS